MELELQEYTPDELVEMASQEKQLKGDIARYEGMFFRVNSLVTNRICRNANLLPHQNSWITLNQIYLSSMSTAVVMRNIWSVLKIFKRLPLHVMTSKNNTT